MVSWTDVVAVRRALGVAFFLAVTFPVVGLVVAAESTSLRSRLCDDQIPDVKPLGCFENL